MSSSPGLLYSATLGKRQPAPQPRRGCVRLRLETGAGVGGVACRNPVGVGVVARDLPKVAEYSNLGLRVATTSWLKPLGRSQFAVEGPPAESAQSVFYEGPPVQD